MENKLDREDIVQTDTGSAVPCPACNFLRKHDSEHAPDEQPMVPLTSDCCPECGTEFSIEVQFPTIRNAEAIVGSDVEEQANASNGDFASQIPDEEVDSYTTYHDCRECVWSVEHHEVAQTANIAEKTPAEVAENEAEMHERVSGHEISDVPVEMRD